MKIISYNFSDGTWWIRIFGRGIHWKNITKHPLIFSERYGYAKTLRIGNWQFKYLPYDKAHKNLY